jgi:chemotaxis protein methyltransferase CheR
MIRMAPHLSPALLDRFSEFVATRFGLNFPPNRQRDLERGALAACREFGATDPAACLTQLIATPPSQAQAEVLASHLTVGETYFFREKAIFNLLENRLLPELIEARRATSRRLRIWSAGCASGEEPYSLAILLSRLLPDLPRWNLTILGTDINARALHKAASGVYGAWSFRHAPPWLKADYVRETTQGRHEIRPDIREKVVFAYHNLVRDPYPSVANNTNAMDIIMCCNVLMYFRPETARQVGERFYHALVDGGWLIVSSGEASPELFPRFERVGFPSAILFRRQAQQAYHPPPARGLSQTAWGVAPTADAGGEDAVPLDEIEAVGACDDLESVIPSPPPSFEEAFALYSGGRYAEAATRLQTLTEPRALALMARLHANQGMLGEALSWCDQAIGSEKLNPRHHYLRASILQELGRNEDALESLKHTLYLDPDFVPAHLALGNHLLRQQKRNQAQRHFRIAYSLLDSYPQDEPLAELEGMTAGRLKEVVLAAQQEDEA